MPTPGLDADLRMAALDPRTSSTAALPRRGASEARLRGIDGGRTSLSESSSGTTHSGRPTPSSASMGSTAG
ncbi:hypothetical protein IHE61_30950 [Streptomyces sp. GKU 257-1]|nr:hypothetical protein [Streptomyces sp. GKU 257-1]